MDRDGSSRVTEHVLRWAIHLYPPEKRCWGEAILAEALRSVDSRCAWSWAIGGFMVALRVYICNLFARSSSSAPLLPTGSSNQAPRWRFALVCLALFGALLFIPELRQAIQFSCFVGKALLTGDFAPPDETTRWEKLGHEAEIRGDAPTMAFAAMRLSDGVGRHFEEAVRLAKMAAAKDASLTWTYYFLDHEDDSRFRGQPHPELLRQLLAWDPGNGMLYLAAAEQAATSFSRNSQPPTSIQQSSPPAEYAKYLKEPVLSHIRQQGPVWREYMARAFAAPTYDDYEVRWSNLQRRIMKEHAPHDLASMLIGEASLRVPNLFDLQLYKQLCFAQAQQAQESSNRNEAEQIYWSIAHFAQRMRISHDQGQLVEGNITDIVAVALEKDAFEKLEPLLAQEDRVGEADVVKSLALEEARQASAYRSESQRTSAFYNSTAVSFYLWALLMFLSLAILGVASVSLAVSRSPSRAVRFCFTYAPLLLLTSSFGLLAANRPYAHAVTSFMEDSGRGSRLLFDFETLLETPAAIHAWMQTSGSIYLWAACIGIGIAICAWLISRSWRHRHAC